MLAQVVDMVVARTGGAEEVAKVDGQLVVEVVGTEFHHLLRVASTPRTLSSISGNVTDVA